MTASGLMNATAGWQVNWLVGLVDWSDGWMNGSLDRYGWMYGCRC